MARKRQRLPAEEARRRILDAAEVELERVGPTGLRLQRLAADLGVSHPAILHHFGTREELIAEVLRRALNELDDDLVRNMEILREPEQGLAQLINRSLETLVDGGKARLLVWLALSRSAMPESHTLAQVAAAAHEVREDRYGEAPVEDTKFGVLLVSLALVADAVFGDIVRAGLGYEDDPEASDRFRRWLVRLLAHHLQGR